LTLGALVQGFLGKVVRDQDTKRKTTTETNLPVEQADGLSRAHAQFPQDSLGLLLGPRLDSSMDYSCLVHVAIVSRMKHKVKTFSSGIQRLHQR